jgi:serine/threonine protein kinase/tetratricopeptide (TPR) repeat protein
MPDRLIKGRYRVKRLLNEGGIARISIAADLLTGESAILKEPIDSDKSSRQAIINEYEFIRLHPHPSIIPVHSFIEEGDQPCIVMPFIDGVDLKSWFSGKTGGMDEGLRKPNIDTILTSLIECTAFIHFCGYLYNDFKPDNFLAVESSEPAGQLSIGPVLLDFNLVCSRGEHPSRRGTLDYISPEVLRGEAPSVASDLYSLGVTIYELFSGHPPHVSPDSDELIKLVTAGGPIDYEAIPESCREGLVELLSPQPGNRPGSAREAARALGLEREFDELLVERLEWYLSAGVPPFADKLTRALRDHLNGRSSKVFMVSGMSHNQAVWNYLTYWLEVGGWEVYRIKAFDCEDSEAAVLRTLEKRIDTGHAEKSILLVDDWETVSESGIGKLSSISGSNRDLPMIVGAGRWIEVEFPIYHFDPLGDNTIEGATAESLKALLKIPEAASDHEHLGEITGGDPELIYRFMLEIVRSGELALFPFDETAEIPVPRGRVPGVDPVLERMCSLLSREEREVLDILSVWGFRTPLLLLADLDTNQFAVLDRLVESRFLVREKEAVAFSSGLAAELIYSRLSRTRRLSYHRFWAETAGQRLEDPLERLDMMAFHWGRSDDRDRGYRVSIEAAVDFLHCGKLSSARIYAEKALELAKEGGRPVSTSLSISADIARQQGDYADARVKYIRLLSLLREDHDDGLRAKSLRELGDTYRSLKDARKAISYTKRALRIYRRLSDDQGVADCHNSIGLANWVVEKYPRALDAFRLAGEINRRLGNHGELAKIESNQGIIKDMMGRTGEVEDHFLKALQEAQKAGDNRLQALILNNLGFFLIRQGEFERSRRHLRAALSLSEQIGYTEEIINSLTNLGLCHLRVGDLFESVDSNQRARELAMSFGNKHLAADAELNLTEACILMGNYGLADIVLASIESSSMYTEDRALKAQVDLLRSKWLGSLGDFARASEIAAGVSDAAEKSANRRLKLEADIAAAAAARISNPELTLSRLLSIVEDCQELGHSDLFVAAGLLISEVYLYSADQFSAESWLEKILSTPNLPSGLFIQASILSAEMLFRRGEFDAALEQLADMEGLAAEKGFVLLALRSSIVTGEILVECRKYAQAEKSYKRACDYRERIKSTLPETVSVELMNREPLMARLSSGMKGIESRSLLKI